MARSEHHSGDTIPVLYEDNHVLAVVKPVNVPTQEDATGDPDLLTLLKADLKDRHHKPGNVFLGLVHRLDRPVGGAMIFAKTSKGASRLSESVRSHALEKEYAAVIHGHPARSEGMLRHYLLKDTRTNNVSSVPSGTAGAKEAVLEYRVIAQSDKHSLVHVKLHTGRSHQIRVQMKEIGCPLYGDQKYGTSLNKPGQQLALWSMIAGAPHPTMREPMRFISLPPRQYPWDQWETEIYERAASSSRP
ncbi:RNA pseudouridine synthase [Paenibacillus sp. JX-17]|uniref:RNA pseudouridylate synthase n=1 Tax=Paenibacillus lacisoli TaxID=3064525 RepID=A0ABT9C6T4_9BACL|nr:RNA pseudouridine synthase [Paenibacillus sp. JX-17]MDO7904984.1 RNA pseudouridine synthase [Paenibacillus sp. JX-17]